MVRLVESQSSYQFPLIYLPKGDYPQRRWKELSSYKETAQQQLLTSYKKTVIAAWLVIAQGFLVL